MRRWSAKKRKTSGSRREGIGQKVVKVPAHPEFRRLQQCPYAATEPRSRALGWGLNKGFPSVCPPSSRSFGRDARCRPSRRFSTVPCSGLCRSVQLQLCRARFSRRQGRAQFMATIRSRRSSCTPSRLIRFILLAQHSSWSLELEFPWLRAAIVLRPGAGLIPRPAHHSSLTANGAPALELLGDVCRRTPDEAGWSLTRRAVAHQAIELRRQLGRLAGSADLKIQARHSHDSPEIGEPRGRPGELRCGRSRQSAAFQGFDGYARRLLPDPGDEGHVPWPAPVTEPNLDQAYWAYWGKSCGPSK